MLATCLILVFELLVLALFWQRDARARRARLSRVLPEQVRIA